MSELSEIRQAGAELTDEPTPEMLEAGAKVLMEWEINGDEYDGRKVVRWIWEAMVRSRRPRR